MYFFNARTDPVFIHKTLFNHRKSQSCNSAIHTDDPTTGTTLLHILFLKLFKQVFLIKFLKNSYDEMQLTHLYKKFQ